MCMHFLYVYFFCFRVEACSRIVAKTRNHSAQSKPLNFADEFGSIHMNFQVTQSSRSSHLVELISSIDSALMDIII